MRSKSDRGTQRENAATWRRVGAVVWPYLSKHRLRFASAFACLFVAVAMRVIEPWPLQFVLDHVLVAQIVKEPAAPVAAITPIALLTICGLAVVLIACVRALFEYKRVVDCAWIGNRIVTAMRRDVFTHLQSLSLSFHAKSRSGDLTVRLVGDLNMIRDVAVTALLPLVASATMLVGMSAIMLWMHWRLGLLAISVFPLFWLAATQSSRKIQAAAKKQRSYEGALAATASESLSSAKVVQALSLEEHFADAFGSQSEKSMKDGVKTSRLSAALERKVDVMVALATALVLWQGARYVLAGELTIGGLVIYLAYLKRGFKPLQDFAKYTGRLSKALAAADRIVEILEESPDVDELPYAKPAPALQGRIEFQNVSFGYVPNTIVLDDLSFSIQPGESIAIVGASGVGKSTLLSLICRLHDPGQGQVFIDGQDIRGWTLGTLRGQQSIVMQENAIFAMTVRENIALLQTGATDEAVEAAARVAGAHEFIERLPQGYETRLGERGTNLSRGQVQRLAIARATLQQAPILLVDEPTTGLDEASERLVVDGILRASQKRTTVIVTHQLSLASQTDRIFVFTDGKIVESGTHRELIGREGRYATIYQNQIARSESPLPTHS